MSEKDYAKEQETPPNDDIETTDDEDETEDVEVDDDDEDEDVTVEED